MNFNFKPFPHLFLDQVSRVNEKLREHGVDLETERKLEGVVTSRSILSLFKIVVSAHCISKRGSRLKQRCLKIENRSRFEENFAR